MKKYLSQPVVGPVLGVIATIYLLEPLTTIKLFLDNLGKGLLISLNNIFFQACANYSNSYLFNQIVMCLLVIAITHSFDLRNEFKSITSESSNTSKVTVSLTDSETIKDLDPNLVAIKIRADKIKKETKQLKFLINMLCISSTLISMNVVYTKVMPATYIEKFDRAIIKITPYVNREQIDILKSDWVRMETKEDFEAIYEVIDRITEENNLD